MKKVLIIEDDIFLVRLYKLKLKKEGFEASYLANTDNLITTAVREFPDLIVLDLVLLQNDGFKVLKSLKNNPSTSSIPVIVLTSQDKPSYAARALKFGAAKYLVKSKVSFKEVIDQVKYFSQK